MEVKIKSNVCRCFLGKREEKKWMGKREKKVRLMEKSMREEENGVKRRKREVRKKGEERKGR